uniref:Structural maintenance of chromosomes protein 6-like n=1 Tax=Tetraselmis sp. GSL018 TaxID=582737 RepID=A0A061S968_9CHLO|eukprot:CAMPEP_0177590320 /NCGR_PEP_ID=MMETSP0419_2-20121207/7329_1 /TAXON_ID=582737 /ORGANISM="Tetraselmis sp., Strain GSL018" /LENGTH=966 /DNA_ID=CAMNT_0019080843 /DNA_START=100 /DNA_END=3000 /DNA_ORIENTATION=-
MSIVGAILSEDETDSASLQRVESFESLSNVWVRKYFPFESADSESEENGQGKYLNGRVTKLEPWLIDLDGSIIKGPFYVVRYDDGEEEHLSFTDLMRIVRDENGLGQPSPVRTNNRRKRDRGEQAALASLSNVDNCGSTQPSLKVRRVDNDDVLRDSGPRQEPELEAHPEPEPEPEPQVQPENTHAPESEQQPQNRTSGQRAGQLLKLRLQNFMCHENFEMDFSPHINFISGTNGSGKSAVLQGIQACLGTRARQTGRSTNLKDFVREGAHHALVAVTLSNTGEDAYKHELYGDRITVERRIGPQSSFVLRSESDRKVEQGERALKAMCEALDINAGNPVAVLTQDTARSFLAGAAKDKEKYSLYMEATLLEQIAEKQAAAEAELKEGKQSLEWKHKLLEKMRAEVEALRGKVSLLRQAADAREHQDMLSKTIAWKRVLACESDLEKLKKQMDELGPMKLRAAEENHSEALQEYTKLRQALESRTNSLHQNQSEVAANVSEIKQLKEALRSAKSRLTETEHIAEAAKRSVADAQKRVEDLVASASEDQANVVSASQAALADHNARVSEKEQQIQSLGVECQNAHETLREQQAILADHANKEDALKGEEDSVAREVRWLQQELARIRNSAHNRVQQFFPRNRVRSGMDLLDQIRQHQSDFEMPPIGPIGQYLSITDDRWAVAVEVALKNTMNKFLVHNQRDAELLRRLASACGYNDIVCVIRRLDLRRHTMDQSQLPPGGTLTVMNVVQCNNPDFETPILNYLIDAASIERVALARNYEEGRQLAYSRIRNIKSAILEDGSQMYQKGCSQAYIGAGTQSICPRLVKNLANQVAGTEERLNIKTAELDDIKQRLDELLRQREHHASKLREFEHRHRSLNKRKVPRNNVDTPPVTSLCLESYSGQGSGTSNGRDQLGGIRIRCTVVRCALGALGPNTRTFGCLRPPVIDSLDFIFKSEMAARQDRMWWE